MTAPTTDDGTPALSTVDLLAGELRDSIELEHIDSLSIHDRHGDPIWMSGDVVGPDENAIAIEAITVFEVEGHRAFVCERLTEDLSAALFPVATARGELAGVVMLVAPSGQIQPDSATKLYSSKVRSLLQRLGVVMKPQPQAGGKNRNSHVPQRPIKARPDPFAEAEAASQASLEQQAANTASLSATARHRALAASSIIATPRSEPIREVSLHVQQLMKLRSGGRTRRYEVLVRGKNSEAGDEMDESLVKALSLSETAGAIDRLVVGSLAKWLKANPTVWNRDPASFSVNLSLGSLLDPSFGRFVTQALQSSGVAPDTIGFEIPESACLKHREAAARFIVECEKVGCYIVLDDFTMHSDAVPFLASRAMRVIKIDPNLTAAAMQDRLSQAVVIAISQASKVLGLHCVAKRIESTSSRQWLAAVGIDFAQGYLLEDPRPIDTLANKAAAPPQRPSAAESSYR